MQPANEELLLECINEHKSYFTRIARRTLYSEPDVEDAIQEMVLKAFKSLKNLKETDYIKTWLTRILINQCYDLLKKRPQAVVHTDSNQGAEDSNYQKAEIRQLVNMLEPSQRVIAVLFYYEDLPQKEIAEVLDLPVGTVKSKLFDARKQLKTMLEAGE